MQEGGVVPQSPDTGSLFMGADLSQVSSLTSAPDPSESAYPEFNLEDVTNLPGWETPAPELPFFPESTDAWFEQQVGPAVPRPEVTYAPSLQDPTQRVAVYPTEEQVNAYNEYVVKAQGAQAELMQLQDDYNRSVESSNQYWKDYSAHLNKTLRESKPESVAAFLESKGDGSLLEYNEERVGYNLPSIGLSKRAVLTAEDLFEGEEMPSLDAINQMIDERVSADERYAGLDEEKMKLARENEFRLILSQRALALAPEEIKDDQEKLAEYELQVYKDINSDANLLQATKDLGFGRLAMLVQIDDDKAWVGPHQSEIEDKWNTITEIGFSEAQKMFVSAGGALLYSSPSAASSDRVMTPYGFSVGAGMVGEEREAARQMITSDLEEYYKIHDKDIQEAREKQNIYANTRESIMALGDLSGYTKEELAAMSSDAVNANAAYMADATTTTIVPGLLKVDSREFRMALESGPMSLAAMGVGVIVGRGNPAVTGVVSGAIMSASVGMEEFVRSGSVDLMPSMFDKDGNPLLSTNERAWRAWGYGLAEGVPEGIGNAITMGVGRLAVGGKLGKAVNPYNVLGRPILERVAGLIGGVAASQGLDYVEEFSTEAVTELFQLLVDDYYTKKADGKVQSSAEWGQKLDLGAFIKENSARILEAGRIGGDMSFLFGGGAATYTYGRAAVERVAMKDVFYGKAINQLVNGSKIDQSLSTQESDRLAQLGKELGTLSKVELVNPSESTRSKLEEVASLVEKINVNARNRGTAFMNLAKVSPEALVDALNTDNQIRLYEKLSGDYTQDANGQWRLNGRFIADPTKTETYQAAQKLSDKKKAEYKKQADLLRTKVNAYAIMGGHAAGLVNLAETVSVGRIKATETQADWRSRDTDVYGEEYDGDQVAKEFFEKWEAVVEDGVKIVAHKTQESLDAVSGKGNSGDGLYLEMPDGSQELHVVWNESNPQETSFVLAHELGHLMTEDMMADDQTRGKLYEEVISTEQGQALASHVFQAYLKTKKGEVAREKMQDPRTRAVVEREVINNYMDKVARGEFGLSSLKTFLLNMGVDVSRSGTLSSVTAKYLQAARNAGVAVEVKSNRALRRMVENEAQKQAAENLSEQEFEKAVEEAGEAVPLASKKINLFRGGTVEFGFNRNIPREGSFDASYSPQSREFNDYFHLINWWRRQTGNGARLTVNNMSYVVDGVRVPIRPTEKWIKKDANGRPVFMDSATTSSQFQRMSEEKRRAIELEYREQKTELAVEIRRLFNDNFKFDGFSLDQRGFYAGYTGEIGSMGADVYAKRNMLALLEKGYTEEQFRDMLGEREYLVSPIKNPELYNLGEKMEVQSLEEQAEVLVNEAEKLGVPAWTFASPDSNIHKAQIRSLFGATQEEIDQIRKNIEDYNSDGDGSVGGEGFMSAPSLASIPINWDPVLEGNDLIQFVSDFGELSGLGEITFRVLKYDRKLAGDIRFPVRTAKGKKDTFILITQAGGPLGPVESVRRGGWAYGPSHTEENTLFLSTAKDALSKNRSSFYTFVALRAEENSLRSTHTMIDYFKYLEKYIEVNPEHSDIIIKELETILNDKEKKITTEVESSKGREMVRFGVAFKRYFRDAAGIERSSVDEKRVEITDLALFLRALQNFEIANGLGFGGRQEFLTSLMDRVHKKTGKRSMNKKELLDLITDPAFKGLEAGTIVAAYEVDSKIAADDMDGDVNLMTQKTDDRALQRFYQSVSFPHATLGLKRVILPRNSELSGEMIGRNLGKKILKEGGESSVSKTYNALMSAPIESQIDGAELASRRLPGRLYVEGNSAWEKSSPTPYGAALQAAALKYQDAFSDVMLLQQDVEVFRKSKVPQSQDFEMAMDTYYGKIRNDLELLENEVAKIQEKMRDNGISSQDVSDYLYAKHAVERNEDILKNRGMRDGSGMTEQKANDIINRLETPAMISIAKDVYGILENTRQTMIDGGLETRAIVDQWRKRYKYYVPLNGLAADEMNDLSNDYPTGGSGMSIYGPSVRKAFGRKTETGNNILGNIVMQNAATKQRARKDQAMLSLYNLVKNNPNDKVWRIISPKQGMQGRNGKNMSADQLKNSRNTVPIRINGEQHFIYFKDQSYADALNGMTIEKLNEINRVMSKYVGFLRNSYTVWNPAFFISNFARDFEIGIVNAIAEIEREGGILEGYGLNSKDFSKKLTKTTWKIAGQLVKEAAFGRALDPETARYFEEWKAAGGRTGWSYSDTLNQVVAELNNLATRSKTGQAVDSAGAFLRRFYANPKQFFEYVEGINEAFENAVRLSAYIEVRKAGMTMERAAQMSKNITVNFNKSGEATAGINSWFLFFNASVQGTTRFARTMRKNEMYVENSQGGTTNKWHKRISTTSKIAGGMVLFSAMQTLFNLAMSDVEDDGELYYNKIPDYRKERNWIIMAGPRDPIYIPLPYGLNIFHNLGMVLAEVGSGSREVLDGAAFMAFSAMGSFSPISFGQYDEIGENVTMGLLPTILKPMAETFLFNKTYFGGSVYREQLPFGAPVPEYQLAYRSPEYLIKLAEYLNQKTGGTTEVPGGININPDKYYYLVQSLTGGAGKFIGDVADLGEGGYNVLKKNLSRAASSDDFIESLMNVEDDEKINIKRSDIPLLKLMYGEASRFYDYDLYKKNRDDINQSMRELKKGSDRTYNLAGVVELDRLLDNTEKVLEKIRELKKMARDIEDYVDRSNTIDDLNESERIEYMMFNASYEELRGQYLD